MHVVVAHGVGADGLKGAGPDVERNRLSVGANLAPAVHQFGCPMQACGGCGDRTLVACKYGLVAVAVGFGIGAVHVRGERNPAYFAQDLGPGLPRRPPELNQGLAVPLGQSQRGESAFVHEQHAVLPLFAGADFAPCPKG